MSYQKLINHQSVFDHPAYSASTRELAAVGIIVDQAQAFRDANYALLGARSNARWWMVPLNPRLQTVTALDLYQPVTLGGRFAKKLASTLCTLGLQRYVFSTRLQISGIDGLAASVSANPKGVAIFTGTDSPHRKTTLQFADYKGHIVAYGKLSCSPNVIPSLQAEANILKKLSELNISSADVPNLLGLHYINDAAFLLTDTLKSEAFKVMLRLGRMHVDFLTELSHITRGGSWNEYLSKMEANYECVYCLLADEWRCRFERALNHLRRSAALDLSLTHGDFTPWNMFYGSKLYIFDWEYADQRPELHDAVHFMVSTDRGLIRKNVISRIVIELSRWYSCLDRTVIAAQVLAYTVAQALFMAEREVTGMDVIDRLDSEIRLAAILDDSYI